MASKQATFVQTKHNASSCIYVASSRSTMTKTYALKRLLEHGGLKISEMVEITNWDLLQCRHAVEQMLKSDLLNRVNTRRGYVYVLK